MSYQESAVTILSFQILQCTMILTLCIDLTAGLVHQCPMPLSRGQGDILGIATLVSTKTIGFDSEYTQNNMC